MIKNTDSRYGLIAILLHWIMACIIFGLFALGIYMVDLTYYDPWYKGALDLHKSIGMTLFLLFILRLTWKAINQSPKPLKGPKWEQVVATATHHSLYLLLFFLMLSGYLISTADGRSIAVFTLIEIPALPIHFAQQEDIAGSIHEILAWTLIILASLHGLAALKHQFINKDNGLMRMIKPK
ncbi:MAG: cytochrome b [Cellvibrionales bacterium]|nr:cytochrome b [Cellvibrionales bacterium]